MLARAASPRIGPRSCDARPIRAAIIGTGWGRTHVGTLRAAGVEVVAIIGTDRARTEEVARAEGVPRGTVDLDGVDMQPGPSAAALERAILASPDADEPRRQLAALLEAQQDPRGRFMTLQLEVAALRRIGASPALAVRQELERSVAQHGATWAGPIAGEVAAYELRRGFVEHVTLDARAFLTKAERLFALAPIRHLTLSAVTPVAAMLFASPHLARMRSLGFAGNELGDRGVALLAASPHVGGLRWLDLDDNEITRAGLDSLAASTSLGSLRFVLFRQNDVGDPTPFSPAADGWSEWDDPGLPALGRELIAQHGPVPWLARALPTRPVDRDYDPAGAPGSSACQDGL